MRTQRTPFKQITMFTLLIISSASTAQDGVAWSAPVDCNAPGEGSLRPRIIMNGDGEPVVLWGNMGPMANYVAVGSGSGFAAPMEVSGPGCMPAVADWMGSSIAAAGNTVWVVMKATPEESKPCYVRRSDDGGVTWGDTIRVDPLDGLISRFPSLDVRDPDMPLVQYMQFDNGWNGARQVVTRMMGSSFMAPVQVSAPFAPGDVCDCCPGQVVAEDDHVVALYRNAGSNVRVMWAGASTDGGATFPVGSVVDTTGWVLPACPSSGPDGYLDGDTIRYVWMSGANNGIKVYLGSASTMDLALGEQIRVHAGQPSNLQQNFPRIAGSGDTLGLVWEQNLLGERDILFCWSTSGVGGLSTPEIVNTEVAGLQKTPDIAFADGAFHIVWNESGTNQVRYRKATVISTVSVAEAPVVDVRLSPNPVNETLYITGGGRYDVDILTLAGKLVLRKAGVAGSIDVGDLPKGEYLCKLSGPDGALSLRFQKM
jgi:hypothetical protein